MKAFLMMAVSLMISLEGRAQSAEMVDETDTSVCRSGAPARSIEGRWQVNLRQNDFRLVMVMDFRAGTVTASNLCQWRGRELTARVSSPYADQGSSFTVFQSASRRESINEPGFNMNCNVGLDAATVSYRPEGSCIRLVAPAGQGADLIMVPARF